MKTEFIKIYEELDNLNETIEDADITNIIVNIEADAKALLQSSPLQEDTKLDLDINNVEIEAEQAKADKEWKNKTPWLVRVRTWFAEKVLKHLLKNEKLYDTLINKAFEGDIAENSLVELTKSLQQLHWGQLEEVAIRNAEKTGVDASNLSLKVISKDDWYSPEKFFAQVLKLIRSGAVKDIYEAVRTLNLELFEYQLVSKELL